VEIKDEISLADISPNGFAATLPGDGGDGEGATADPPSEETGDYPSARRRPFASRQQIVLEGAPTQAKSRRPSVARTLTGSWMSTMESTKQHSTGFFYRIVSSWAFESICSVCILVNCATMGMQAHNGARQELGSGLESFLEISEHVFTGFFLAEFLMRLYVYGFRHFVPLDGDRRANFVDAVLVIVTGVLITWIVPLVRYLAGVDGQSGVYRMLTVLRAVRLARLVRVFRKSPMFREAWLLVRGLNDSCRTLFWTVVVIFFVTYTFAIFGVVMVVGELQGVLDTTKDEEERERIQSLLDMTAGLDRMMYTLVQVVLGDSFHAFMREILFYVTWSWIYFYAYIALACLVLMNLVTAIIVENAMETSRNDHEQQVQEKKAKQSREVSELRHLFTLMDADGSGTLCWDEFKGSFLDPEMSKKWMLLDFQPEDCKELFRLLDDGDGEIETNEFFEGLTRMKGPAQSKDVYRLQKAVWKIQTYLEETMDQHSPSGSPVYRSSSARTPRLTAVLPKGGGGGDEEEAAAKGAADAAADAAPG